MLQCVALVRTDVLEECIASIIRVTRISKLGTMLAVISNQSRMQSISLQHTDDGGDVLLRNIGSHKSHGVTFQDTAFFIVTDENLRTTKCKIAN
jgi:hypothetical protein